MKWRICILIAFVLIILAFTPLLIPEGKYRPELFGIPFSLWTSFLITLVLVVLTWIGSKVHPSNKEEDQS